ncbi:MAG: 3-phosphoshikimate 1-carboxyvinyltransferase [Bacteroidales bacterium]|nr:3-phosphoshikimate 1-carboxyvinyltransferase [Bacteroidales bacterium]
MGNGSDIIRVKRPEKALNASVVLPASKSISNRLLIIRALAGNKGNVTNLSESDDTRVMLEALASDDPVKDVGHAGTTMRFLTAYFSCRPGKVRMTGSDRMKERPIGPLVDALRDLGAEIRYTENEGFPPLEISRGRMTGGEVHIDGGISSQFISALLMIAPVLERGMTLHLTGEVVSEPYISMTLSLMGSCGAVFSREGNTIAVKPGGYSMGEYAVESDWSAASYWYAMALLENHCQVRLSYFEEESLQGDSSLVDIFHRLGLVSDFRGKEVMLNKLVNLHPGMFEHDFTSSPDLVQSMAVALCMAEIPFRFTGTQTLRIKETDRIRALQQELKKLGYVLESDERGSYLSWNKQYCTPEENPVIETYHDHRMAMAFAPVALVKGEVLIKDPMVVTKSYPGFWEDMKKAGFRAE